MMQFSPRQQKIILSLIQKGTMSSSLIHKEIAKKGDNASLVTIKRELSELVKQGYITISGAGRSVAYTVGTPGRIFSDINAREYCVIEPDKRYGMKRYNFNLFSEMPSDIFFDTEQKILESATAEYAKRTENLPPAIQKRELERMIIELSWKSSRIEGNT